MDDELDSNGSIELADQRRRLQEAFEGGWVTPARDQVTFSEDELARIDYVREHGGFLNKDEHEYLQRLIAGGRRGESLPPAPKRREPFIRGLADDFEVRIAGAKSQANVVILFSHAEWPGIRFGHRFPTPEESDGYGDIWLKEEIETGGLARLMNHHPQSDDDGIVWTDWLNR